MIAPTYTRLINIVYNLAAHIIVEKEEKKNDFFQVLLLPRDVLVYVYTILVVLLLFVLFREFQSYI